MPKLFKKVAVPLLIVITLTMGLLFFQEVYAQSIELEALGSTGLGTKGLVETVASIIQVFLGFLGVIAIGIILYGGFVWMTAGGSEEKVSKAKKILINAVIGLIIILSAFAITTFLIDVISGSTGPGGPSGPPECDDGIDNDGDTYIDFPADPGCFSLNDNSEADTGQPPQTGFYVQGTTPGDNATGVSVCTAIQAWFNYNIDDTTILPPADNFHLNCVSGNCQGVTVISGALTVIDNAFTFIPDDDLPINSTFNALIDGGPNGVKDTQGRALSGLGYPWVFSTGDQDDNTPPQVNYVYPEDNWTNVCLNTVILAEFNEPMLISSLSQSNSIGMNPYSGTFGFTVNNSTTFTYSPNQTLIDNTTYTPLLNSDVIMDVCQNLLDGDFDGIAEGSPDDDYAPPGQLPDWSFTTGQTPECIPEIDSITSPGYYDGSSIIITGSDFTNSFQGDKNVIFNNNLAVYDDSYCLDSGGGFPQQPNTPCLVSWSANNIEINVPAMSGNSNGAITGPVKVEVQGQGSYLPSNLKPFDVDSPHVDNAYPAVGGEGQFVSLWGTNFGTIEGEVYFINSTTQEPAELPCDNVGWKDDNIIIAVPVNIAIGDWQIQIKTDGGHWSNLGDFEVNSDPAGPGLCELVPDSGFFEYPFELKGEDFGTTQGQVYFGNFEAPIVPGSWGDSSIDAYVPNLAAGVAPVSVMDSGGLYSNSLPFTVSVTAPPDFYITYISPEEGPEEQYVTIYGSGFGATMGDQKVCFGSIEGDFTFPAACGTNYWNNTQVIVKVPPGAGSNVIVCRPNQPNQPVDCSTPTQFDCTNGELFTLNYEDLTPGICSINPISGLKGSSVTIAGEPFDTVNTVELSNTSALFNNVSQYEIVFTVPDTTTGQVIAYGPGGDSNPVNFEVTGGQAAGGPFDYYEWQFETCQSCLVPQVDVLACYEYNGMLYSSPSPFINSQDNFTDIDLAVKFNTEMDINSFVWGNTVILNDCGDDPNSCTPVTGFTQTSLSLDQNSEWLSIDLDGALTTDTWYYVELTGNIRSLEGWQLDDSKGYNDWYFKTQATGEECVADTVNVIPHPSYSIIGNTIGYNAWAIDSYSCNICDESNYIWDWISGNSSQADIQTFLDNQCTVKALDLANPVAITAEADPIAPGSMVSGYSDLYITFGGQGDPCSKDPMQCVPDDDLCATNFYCEAVTCVCEPLPVVTNYGPDCGNACTNTSIFAEFSMEMQSNTMSQSNILVKKCTDSTCTSYSDGVIITIDYSQGPPPRVNINPVGLLDENHWYRVILMENIKSIDDQKLSNLNFSYQNPDDSFSWTFQVTDVDCDISSVSVSPDYWLFTDFSQDHYYTGYAYTDGNCLAPLNPNYLTWSWELQQPPSGAVSLSYGSQIGKYEWEAEVESQAEGIDYVRAEATETITGNTAENTGDNGKVVVNLAGPEVLETCVDPYLSPTPQDNREDVCVNASVSARFNQAMKSVTFSYVTVRDCFSDPQNCSGSVIPVNPSQNIQEGGSGPIVGFIIAPTQDLVADHWYEVTIPTTVTSISGIPMENEYKWYFKTRDNPDICEPQVVTVDPPYNVLSHPSAFKFYDASAQTGVCDLILNGIYDWNWTTFPTTIVTITSPQLSQTEVITDKVGETEITATIMNITPQLSGYGDIIVTEPPLVDSTEPDDGDTDVCRNAEISATFNQLMNLATLNSNTIVVKKEVIVPFGQNPPEGCEGGTGGITFNSFIKRQFALVTGFFDKLIQKVTLKLFNQEFYLFEKALAQPQFGDPYWCPVSGNFGSENVGGLTTVYFNPFYILDASTKHEITILGGEDGVKNLYNLEMADDFVWSFTTGPDICLLNFVKVYGDYVNESDNTNSWFFTSNVNDPGDDTPGTPLYDDNDEDADKVYKAKAYSVSGQPLAQYLGVYEWIWKDWQSDNTIVAIIYDPGLTPPLDEQTVIAQNENGEAKISVTAEVTVDDNFGITGPESERTGFAMANVFICENPWYDPALSLPYGTYGFEEGYFIDNTYNHKLIYCRDYGGEGTYDDLPLLDIDPIYKPETSFPQVTGEDNLIEEFLFWIYYFEAPSNLSAVAQGMNIIDLNWTGVEDDPTFIYYELEIATNALFTQSQPLITIPGVTTTSYSEMGLGAGTTHYYRIRAVYDNGYSSWSNIATGTTNTSVNP